MTPNTEKVYMDRINISMGSTGNDVCKSKVDIRKNTLELQTTELGST